MPRLLSAEIIKRRPRSAACTLMTRNCTKRAGALRLTRLSSQAMSHMPGLRKARVKCWPTCCQSAARCLQQFATSPRVPMAPPCPSWTWPACDAWQSPCRCRHCLCKACHRGIATVVMPSLKRELPYKDGQLFGLSEPRLESDEGR